MTGTMESSAALLGKRAAATAAAEFVRAGRPLGVGSGSTVEAFIELLAELPQRPSGAAPASAASAEALQRAGIPVVAPPGTLDVYIDGADEVDPSGRAIKGGGGAHTREKLLSRLSRLWVCIVDESKVVERIGSAVPVPLEVGPTAIGGVTSVVLGMGGTARLRDSYLTDAGNAVLDVTGLSLDDPVGVERALDRIPGVLGNGVFAERVADIVIVGRADGSTYRLKG